ncbi:unnamed protein product [Mytilus edulis]|uniref:Uncharacterized protein n=1 Tax=Mytilus edulis TaxID=6550 RepID=A0A8S3TPH0_MYTED|nr:unnamed protein product [Mytilus edulis]
MANIVPVIRKCTKKKLDDSTITHLKQFLRDIELADNIPGEIESSSMGILVNDYYLDLILSQRIEFQHGLYLLASKLGWISTGRAKSFWKIKVLYRPDEEKTELLKQYNGVIQEQLKREIIEKVEEKTDSLIHYIPYHAGITLLKSTTKVRIVYDASSKTNKDVKSLNKCLYRGPVMLKKIIFKETETEIELLTNAVKEKEMLACELQKENNDLNKGLRQKQAKIEKLSQ